MKEILSRRLSNGIYDDQDQDQEQDDPSEQPI